MVSQLKGFRNDINGLRAWAIVPVVFYHFAVPGFSGGFVGVDIFFVISGFLMTGIIVTALEKPGAGFSVLDFYLSRARRIVPALAVMCAVLLVLGWFCLAGPDYRMLATHAITALGFFSNIKFWREAGYFDGASHEKLLLHTWSLSVEWQFYLILPLVLLAVWKLRAGRTPLKVVIIAGLLLSLLLCVFLSPIKPTAAFYLLPTRAWELLAGGLVFLFARPLPAPLARAMEGVGFVLIIVAVALFDTASNWPGWRAAVPVLGSVLVLTAARQGSGWTGTRAAQWLGDCSYSLYLWHWPLVVALVYTQRVSDPLAIAAGMILTLLIGRVSYRWVEIPARNRLTRLSFWPCAASVTAAVLLISLVSLWLRTEQGLPGRFSPQIQAVFNESRDYNPRKRECFVEDQFPIPECTYGGDTLGAIVLGDSHGDAMIRTVEKVLPNTHLNVLDWTIPVCPTIFGIKREGDPGYRCGDFLAYALEKSKTLPPDVPLIIVNRTSAYLWGENEPDAVAMAGLPTFHLNAPKASRTPAFLDEMRDGLIETACAFAQTRPVYIVRPTPELKLDVPKTMGRALILGEHREVSISMDEYRQRHALAWQAQDAMAERCGVKILDPIPYLCHDGKCKGDVDGVPIYYDDDHLSIRGADLLIPMFRHVFDATPAPVAARK
jgi:peptidoglycan/LPS O-acetylase OafA/YrhL